MVFYSSRYLRRAKEEYPTPEGEIYDPYREQMVTWIKEIRAMPYTKVSITSYDGLKLCGKYYEQKKGAPIEIMFHGYKGTAERDLCGGVFRAFALGRNALIVDHRASGESEGKVITFGIKESRDCLKWVNYVIEEIDPNAKIILTGISMGAATVMTAASMDLPDNVVGILADCGYTSAKDIIKKVIRDMKLPATLLYPFVRISAKIFGRFDPDEVSPIASMKKCSLPIIFIHGDTDDFVPCSMSEENYNACNSPYKRFLIIPEAGHGLCFPKDQEAYFDALKSFFDPILIESQ
ncbi:MAG: alpha/beta hydrolase [Clostridia bacterium]|nr:alpha/beta hydrolase [Clostridia bacterium]